MHDLIRYNSKGTGQTELSARKPAVCAGNRVERETRRKSIQHTPRPENKNRKKVGNVYAKNVSKTLLAGNVARYSTAAGKSEDHA
ncbi:hypothetical protein KCP78_00395 [Salmonella enterica subsp. enterica]|nr:hypothetical protein KCP78_00395 [Salmonella enterica subsp. enterica]